MNFCRMTAGARDGALDAIALVENSVEDNPLNRNAILANANAGDLIIGLVYVASFLRSSLAVASNVSEGEIDELLRAAFLTAEAS